MSKLEELIKEFCPNGVEYISVEELLKEKTISSITPSLKIKRNDYKDFGEIPIISQEEEYISGYCNIFDKKIIDGQYVCFGDHTENVKYVDFRFVQGADGLKIICCNNKEKIDIKYFYYAVCNFYKRHNNYERHYKYFVELQIPLPALPVQREIVRILDSFTLYSAELTAELTARCKQYEYYRDKLLNFTCNIIQTNIGQVCNVFTGGEPPVEHIKGDVPTVEYKYPIWGNGKDIYGYSKTFQIGQDAVVISSIGANTGAVYFRKANFTPIIRLKVLTPKNNDVNIRYLFYYLSNKKIESKSSSVPNMNSNEIKQLSIEIPPIEVQERIVKVLDNFDAICSDLGIGLPAEIEKRQKQYEYYREKLLTFDDGVATILTDRQTDRQD